MIFDKNEFKIKEIFNYLTRKESKYYSYFENICKKFIKFYILKNNDIYFDIIIQPVQKGSTILKNCNYIIPLDQLIIDNNNCSYGTYFGYNKEVISNNSNSIKNIICFDIVANKKDNYKVIYTDKEQVWLIYGLNGYIGQQFLPIIQKHKDIKIIYGKSKVDNYNSVEKEIQCHKPNRVISMIGRMYGNNTYSIQYLEQNDKLYGNIRDNLYSPLILCILTNKYNIHLTYFGSACIFSYDDEHTIDCKRGFTEIDTANYFGSNYVTLKGFTDKIMSFYNNVLNLRIRMTMTRDKDPRNLLHKIINFDKIHNYPNSMTILSTLFDTYIDMIRNEYHGTFNFCNEGAITFNEILEIYNKEKKMKKKWEIVTDNSRANNYVNIDMLQMLYPNQICSISKAITTIIKEY